MYNKKTLKHFTNPRFFGKIKNPNAIGKTKNPHCGDLLTLYLKIDKKSKKIKDIKFETLGCGAAIAASDMICELAKNKTLNKAMDLSFKDISQALGNLPPIKVHCAQLAIEALNDAINKYKNK